MADMGIRGLVVAVVASLGAGLAVLVPAAPAAAAAPPVCGPLTPPVTYTGAATSADARSYLVRPFTVVRGTTRVEVTYDWTDNAPPLAGTPVTKTTMDLGVWDQHGYKAVDGFRGWSGSRAGRVAAGQPPVFIQQDVAQRGYRPGPIEPGAWWLELGFGGLAPSGATWTMTVKCSAPPVGAPFVSRPVDPSYVARPAAGWFEGDFHMHGVHSNLRAPNWSEMVAYARSVGLDFLPITEYVTNQHWRELGPVQAANPDMLLWPSREIITYFGHMIALGETPHAIDYRQGFEDVSALAVQRASKADGALFQVAHPTTFPGPVFRNFCRGCEFQLGSVIDWNAVDTLEVLTGPILVDSGQVGLPTLPGQIENPFTRPAINLWVNRLMAGNKITAVSGSDSKGVEDVNEKWGTDSTSVFADQLSRPALKRALQAGHAYVRAKGAHASPELRFTAALPGGGTAMFGDVVHADGAPMTVTVKGAMGQRLTVYRNRQIAKVAVINADPFTYTFTANRSADEGPLGTFWRVETADIHSLTTIGNPIFLAGPASAPPPATSPPTVAGTGAGRSGGALPVTGDPYPAAAPVAAAAVALAVVANRERRWRRARRRPLRSWPR
jgi:hypothetical protein